MDPRDELDEINADMIVLKEWLDELNKRRKKIDLGRDCEDHGEEGRV